MAIHLSGGLAGLNQIVSMNNKSSGIVLIDFFAQWCGPCKQIAPGLDQLARTNRLVVVKVDVDDNSNEDLVSSFKVNAMPTLVWIVNGIVKKRMEGANLDRIQEITMDLLSK